MGVGTVCLFKESGGEAVVFAERFACGAFYDGFCAVFPEDDGGGRIIENVVYAKGFERDDISRRIFLAFTLGGRRRRR